MLQMAFKNYFMQLSKAHVLPQFESVLRAAHGRLQSSFSLRVYMPSIRASLLVTAFIYGYV